MTALADLNRQAAANRVPPTPEPARSDARDLDAWMATWNRQRFAGKRPKHSDCAPCDGRGCDERCKLW